MDGKNFKNSLTIKSKTLTSIFVERINSHPNYQWQPFVQTPSFEHHEELNLEEGETIYEDRRQIEWNLFIKLSILVALAPLITLFYESYNGFGFPNIEYLSGFSSVTFGGNQTLEKHKENFLHNFQYWGNDMWFWQHGFRSILVPTICAFVGPALFLFVRNLLSHRVVKMSYNKNRDVIFILRSYGILNPTLHTQEVHFLQQMVPYSSVTWKHLGSVKGTGYFKLHDLKNYESFTLKQNDKFWNPELKEIFMEQTQGMWKGLRDRNLDTGLKFNRSQEYSADQALLARETNYELKKAIEKHGPVMGYDADYNHRYQFEKKLLKEKRNLLERTGVRTI